MADTDRTIRVLTACSAQPLPVDLVTAYLALMPEGIRSAVARYRRWQDRQATLFGKLLLMKALGSSACKNRQRKLDAIEQGILGKPWLPGGPEFSISHSGGRVVVAVAHHGAVGIDIEKIRPIDTADFVRYLPECAQLDTTQTGHLAEFFDCWTSKEAILKADGAGLSVPLESVLLQGEKAELNGKAWYVKKLAIDADYCCHMAAGQPVGSVVIEEINLFDRETVCLKEGT